MATGGRYFVDKDGAQPKRVVGEHAHTYGHKVTRAMADAPAPKNAEKTLTPPTTPAPPASPPAAGGGDNPKGDKSS